MRKYQSGGTFYKDTSHLFREYKPVNLKANLPEMTKILRERYDKGVESKSVLDQALGSIRTLNDVEQAKINRVKMEIDEMLEDRTDFENMDRLIKMATTKLVTDHSVLNAIDSYNEKRKEDEVRNQLTAQGKTPLDFNMVYVRDQDGRIVKDPATKAPVMQHQSMFHDSDRDGIYGHKVEEHLQWSDKAAQLIQGIASDTHMMERARMKNVDPMEVQSWLMQTGGVSKAKIEEISSFLVDEFKGTREGDQMFRALTQLEVNPSTGDLYTPEEAEKKMLSSLRDIGMKQRSSNFQYAGARFDPNAGAGERFSSPVAIPSERKTTLGEKLSDKAVDEYLDPKKPWWEKFTTGEWKGSLGKEWSAASALNEAERTKLKSSELKKLQDAYDSGKLLTAVTPDTNPGVLIEFITSNPDYQKSYPQLRNEDPTQYAKRLVGVFRDTHQPNDIRIADPNAAKELAREAIVRGGSIFSQRSGDQAVELKTGLWRPEEEDAPGVSLLDFGVEKTLLEALEPGGTAVIDHITTGSLAGKWKISFRHSGRLYNTAIEPVAGMTKAFSGMAQLNEAASSMKPGTKAKISMGDLGSVFFELVPETQNGKSTLTPYVVYTKNGVTVEETLSEAESYLNTRLLEMYGRLNNKLSQVHSMYSERGEKPAQK